jgi:hypothetical protein
MNTPDDSVCKPSRCVYCGRPGPHLTKEHIPQRSLFPDPKPENLITVPSCQQCNQGFSKDEEYFLCWLALLCSEKDADSMLMDKMFRILSNQVHLQEKRSEQTGMHGEVFSSLASEIRRKMRLNGQGKPALPTQDARVKNVLGKIAKGLYFYYAGELPEKNAEIQYAVVDEYNHTEIGVLLSPEWNVSLLRGDKGIFKYAGRVTGKSSCWLFEFYSRLVWVKMMVRENNN